MNTGRRMMVKTESRMLKDDICTVSTFRKTEEGAVWKMRKEEQEGKKQAMRTRQQ